MSPSDSAANSAIVADQYLGNTGERADLAIDVTKAERQQTCLTITIARQDCGKGRLLTHAADGRAVGIIKDRSWRLRDRDVLKTQTGQLVLVNLQKQPVIALQFERKAINWPANLLRLGHVIGNHHWPMTIEGETLYIEVAANADLIESTLREAIHTLDIKGLYMVREYRQADNALDFSTASLPVHSHTH